jgi:hypothetical protein
MKQMWRAVFFSAVFVMSRRAEVVLRNRSSRKIAKDPDYNPVIKTLNVKVTDFTIDAISIQIIN